MKKQNPNNLPTNTNELVELLTKALTQISNNNKQLIKITLGDWLTKDLELSKNKLSENSLRSIKSSYKYAIEFFSSDRFMDKITLEQTNEFYNWLFSKVSNRVYWRTLKASFNRAVEFGYLQVNYFNNIRLPRKQKAKVKTITRHELDLIIANTTNATLKKLYEFTYLTGLRLAEVTLLSWNDVSLSERIITVGSDDFITKARNTRVVPLCNTTYNILTSLYPKILAVDKKNFVFVKKGTSEPFTTSHISKNLKRAVRKANLSEDIHFHCLRHSYATNLANNKISSFTIQRLLGHTNINTTQIYVNPNIDDLRNAINTLNKDQQIKGVYK